MWYCYVRVSYGDWRLDSVIESGFVARLWEMDRWAQSPDRRALYIS